VACENAINAAKVAAAILIAGKGIGIDITGE
jgi:hypothetical protein